MSGLPSLGGFLKKFLPKHRSYNEDLPPYSESDPLVKKAQRPEEAEHNLQRITTQHLATTFPRLIPTSKFARANTEKGTSLCQKCCTSTVAYHETGGQLTTTNQGFEEEASLG